MKGRNYKGKDITGSVFVPDAWIKEIKRKGQGFVWWSRNFIIDISMQAFLGIFKF